MSQTETDLTGKRVRFTRDIPVLAKHGRSVEP